LRNSQPARNLVKDAKAAVQLYVIFALEICQVCLIQHQTQTACKKLWALIRDARVLHAFWQMQCTPLTKMIRLYRSTRMSFNQEKETLWISPGLGQDLDRYNFANNYFSLLPRPFNKLYQVHLEDGAQTASLCFKLGLD